MRPLVLALLIAVSLPLSSSAVPLTVVMGGEWDSVDDAGNVLGGAVLPGTAFTATMTYDDTAPPTYSDPITANYDVGALPFSFTLATGGFTFTWLAGGFTSLDLTNTIYDGVAGFFEDFSGAPGLPPIGYAYASPSLDDPSGTALASTALPPLPWSLAAWPTAALGFFFDIDDGDPQTYVDLQGTLTSLTVVPEPGTSVLLAMGLALLAARARR
mgnify:CR=1 FL=1